MKTKLIYYIVIIGSIVILSLAFNNHIIRKSLSELEDHCYDILRIETVLKLKSENNRMWREIQYEIWFSSFDNVGEIIDHPINNSLSLSGNSIIVYWFNQNKACDTCIEEDMDILKELMDTIGQNKFLVLSDFIDNREIELFENKYSLNDVCYKVKEGELIRKLDKTPFVRLLFIVNKSNQILFPVQIETKNDLKTGPIIGLLDYFSSHV